MPAGSEKVTVGVTFLLPPGIKELIGEKYSGRSIHNRFS